MLGPVDAQPVRHDAMVVAINGIKTRRDLLGMVQRNRIARTEVALAVLPAFNCFLPSIGKFRLFDV